MSDPLFPRFGRELHAGDVLFREGEPGDVMFVVQSGLVRVSKHVGGAERTLATLGRGEFVGEMAILNDKPRTATATVVEDAQVLVIDAKTLETMLGDSPEIALRLVKKLALRLDGADELVQILLNPDPEARVMLSLRRLAASHAQQTGRAGETIETRLTPAALAADVGVDVSRVQEVLRRLRRVRVTSEAADGTVIVPSLARLLEFLEFLEMPRVSSGAAL